MSATPETVSFEAFGVGVQVTGDTPEAIDGIRGLLPPGAKPCDASVAQQSFSVLAEDGGAYRLIAGDDVLLSAGLGLESALTLLESELHGYVGVHAPGRIFVHAGVVGHAGKAIVVPGRSLAGKTTLVLALVEAGAAYYSDDFAVLDDRGFVHPFAKLPSPRPQQSGDALGELDDLQSGEPLPIGTLVLTSYQAGVEWDPVRVSSARGVLGMFENTLVTPDRSEEAIRVIRTAVDGATVLAGDRGEAAEVARRLLGTGVPSPRLSAARDHP